jgi:hypothetical protein
MRGWSSIEWRWPSRDWKHQASHTSPH